MILVCVHSALIFHPPKILQIPSSSPSKLGILIGKLGVSRCFFARVTPNLDAVIVDGSSQTGLRIACELTQALLHLIDASRRSCFLDLLVTASDGIQMERSNGIETESR